MSSQLPEKKLTYALAGVDVRAGEETVERIKRLARSTFGPNVLSEIGSFGGFFRLPAEGHGSPVLVASADGVGTKLKLAFMTGRHDTVGEDLVNHCANDILVHGARGLFFLDYIATGKLEPNVVADIVSGLSRACAANGMALLGGETAEMPDFYQIGEYDLAGFIVGVVDEKKIINGSAITVGDVCIGLPSTGLHTNGYSLARKVVFDVAKMKATDRVDELRSTVGEALMAVHRCYASVVFPLLNKFDVHGMAHITGGGIPGNLNRILPAHLDAEIDSRSWIEPPLFGFLRRIGNLDPVDIYSAFNMGIGYILVVSQADADAVTDFLRDAGEVSYRIGTIVPGRKSVRLV